MENPFDRAVEMEPRAYLEDAIRNELKAYQAIDDSEIEAKDHAARRIETLYKLLQEEDKQMIEIEKNVNVEKQNDVKSKTQFYLEIASLVVSTCTTIGLAASRQHFDNRWMEKFMLFENDGNIITSDTFRAFKQKRLGANK